VAKFAMLSGQRGMAALSGSALRPEILTAVGRGDSERVVATTMYPTANKMFFVRH
jgi:hypothetical protein